MIFRESRIKHMMLGLMETIFVFAVISVFAVTAILGLTSVFSYLSKLECNGYQDVTGIETKYNHRCYAKINGEWVGINFDNKQMEAKK